MHNKAKRMPHTVADALVAQLAAAGVQRIYGVIGDAVFPLAAALQRQNKVQYIAAAHEANAAYMASYEAKLTGRPTACMATSGPGATNLATGLADAYFDGAPVLAITGQVQSTKFGTGAKQYFDQQTFFQPITSSTELVLGGEAALHAVLSALVRSVTMSTATHVSIPVDVFEQPLEWKPIPVTCRVVADGALTAGAAFATDAGPAAGADPGSGAGGDPDPGAGGDPDAGAGTASDPAANGARGVFQPRAGGDETPTRRWSSDLHVLGDAALATARLREARQPLLVLGMADAEVVHHALKLAELIGAAVVAAQQTKGAVPHHYERLIGGIGEAHVPHLVNEADLLVLVGEAPYEIRFIPPHLSSIVVSPVHRSLPKLPLLAEWIGDVPTALRLLVGALRPETGAGVETEARATRDPDAPTDDDADAPARARDAGGTSPAPVKPADVSRGLAQIGMKTGGGIQVHYSDRNGTWQGNIQTARQDLANQVEQLRDGYSEDGCNPYQLAVTLSEFVAEDAIISVDVGAFSHWFDLGFRAKRQTVLASSRWRGIGFALPAAIGAQLANPGRQVVAVVGDGALLQSMAELTTAVRYKLPIVIIVVNNEAYDIERQKMAAHGFGDLGADLPAADVVIYAEACETTAMRVATLGELHAALEEGLRRADDCPVLIDVRTTVPSLPHLTGAPAGS